MLKTLSDLKSTQMKEKFCHNRSELQSFICQWHNKLVLGNLEKDVEVEMICQITQQLDLPCTTDLVKSVYEQIDILKREVYFLREELSEKIIF